MLSRPHISLLPAALLLAACSTGDDAPETDLREVAAPLEASAGSVLIDYDPNTADGVGIHAQFIQAQGVSPDAAFQALEIWRPDRELDADACSMRAMPMEGTSDVRLRLLDVGPISVTLPPRQIELDGRWLPDVGPFSGVVYGNEEGFDIEQAYLPYETGGHYQVVATGTESAGGFNVSLQGTAVPTIELVSGHLPVGEQISLAGDDLRLAWTTTPSDGTQLYLDVQGADASASVLRCRLEDDGEFVVPSSILETFPSAAPLDVALRRVDIVELPTEGVDDTEFIFAATSRVTIRR